MQTRIKGKTFTMEEIEFSENYGDNTDEARKELLKVIIRAPSRKGDHKTAAQVDGKETDMHNGGAAKGKSKFSAFLESWSQ